MVEAVEDQQAPPGTHESRLRVRRTVRVRDANKPSRVNGASREERSTRSPAKRRYMSPLRNLVESRRARSPSRASGSVRRHGSRSRSRPRGSGNRHSSRSRAHSKHRSSRREKRRYASPRKGKTSNSSSSRMRSDRYSENWSEAAHAPSASSSKYECSFADPPPYPEPWPSANIASDDRDPEDDTQGRRTRRPDINLTGINVDRRRRHGRSKSPSKKPRGARPSKSPVRDWRQRGAKYQPLKRTTGWRRSLQSLGFGAYKRNLGELQETDAEMLQQEPIQYEWEDFVRTRSIPLYITTFANYPMMDDDTLTAYTSAWWDYKCWSPLGEDDGQTGQHNTLSESFFYMCSCGQDLDKLEDPVDSANLGAESGLSEREGVPSDPLPIAPALVPQEVSENVPEEQGFEVTVL